MTMSAEKTEHADYYISVKGNRNTENQVSPGKLGNITTGGSGPTKSDPEDEDSGHALQFVCHLYVAPLC